jgi:hypothetical protein
MRRLILLATLSMFLMVACSSQKTAAPAAATKAPAATATPAPPIGTPTATPLSISTPPPIGKSGGLGLSRGDWETKYGKPGKDSLGFIDYVSGKYVTKYRDDAVDYLERHWGDQGAVTMDAARTESKALIPTDASLVKTYTATGGRTVDLYTSNSLVDRFKVGPGPYGNPWTGSDPGTFIVLYRTDASNRVFTILAAIGDNP